MEISNILSFTIKISLSLTLVWGLWFAFMRNLNRFALVRSYLLFGIIISILLPLLMPLIQNKTSVSLSDLGFERSFIIPDVTIGIRETSINWYSLLFILYMSISGVFLLRFMLQIIKIALLAKGNVKYKKGGIYIIEHSKGISPFSFMNYCFINPTQIPNDKIEGVIAHERAHYTRMHSADILLMELVGLSQWFNPFYWMLRKALVEIHEYQADNTAIQYQTDPYAYLDTIVSIAFQGIALPVGNNFNKSLTLKRLAMLSTKKVGKIAIPALILSSVMAVGIIVTISCSKNPEIDAKDETFVVAKNLSTSTDEPKDEKIYTTVDEMPIFDDDETTEFIKFRHYLAKNLRYPEEAAKKGVEGRVFVSFVVDSEGSVTKVKVVRGVEPSLDNEAVRVIQSSPKWQPGKQEGVAVSTQFTFPIVFKLQ
jgi:TonB family protein